MPDSARKQKEEPMLSFRINKNRGSAGSLLRCTVSPGISARAYFLIHIGAFTVFAL